MSIVERSVRIIGMDPGTRVAGYGVVEVFPGGVVRALAAGAWNLDASLPLAARLAALAIEFRRVITTYQPTIVCIELPFVSNNARSALVLGSARGVILSEAHQAGLQIAEIAATSAKKTITGNGYAEKERVMRTLQALLNADLGSLPYDATDALAIAYAHALKREGDKLISGAVETNPQRNALIKEWSDSQKRGRRSLKSFSRQISRGESQ